MRELQAARGAALTGNKIATSWAGTMGAADSPGDRRRRVVVLLAVAAGVLVADIITKVVVVATLSDRAPVRLLGGLLTLRVIRNPGAAFSIGGPSVTAVFALIAVGVIAFIVRTSRRIRSLGWAVTLGLLLGGATGNLVDRLLRSPGPFRGYVVDWIQVPHWPVFNIADSCIVCGGVLAVFLAVRGVRIDGTVGDVHGNGDGRPDGGRPDGDRPGGRPGGGPPERGADGDHGGGEA